MKTNNLLLITAVTGSLFTLPLSATPYTHPDGAWITVTGKVTKTSPSAFILDYGKGAITVEMDDYDWYAEGSDILVDDKVVVTGRIDADEDEPRTIEASSVFVKGENLTFYASASDDEDVRKPVRIDVVEKIPTFSFYGKVTSIDGDTMTMDNGYQVITVNTSELSENAFDDDGDIQLEINDWVTTTAHVHTDYASTNVLNASTVIEHEK
ncbi:hypothetical protein JIN77_00180 [Verrucomicrobiaceae bacterium R5-34]|uniref:Bacterial OB-fold domain-containing protein n=1 Tax=Oceaniferula flava TaxID=2800421 RepID=A0AAE2S947_9BACT|nr:hypothetical protein [Oceaniferula flavus]MBK1829130.1 hypothetical protein [Verrucomicrobiaceae bacterium R5-34]MBK1853366.1 hypothetical protein [Oceaniferula flavus]MBM1134671.1 hypothetical protein [Oceaniferula flavus]